MKNIDLETLYSKSKTTLKIASSYVGNSLLEKIIVSCRLKPITVFDGTFRDGKLETWWVDEFGNSMYLTNNKIVVVKQDEAIRYDTKIGTDLFYGRSIIGTMALSKSVMLFGDIIIFCGQDEYFRSFDKRNGNKISPLEAEINELTEMYKNYYEYKLPNNEIEVMIKKEFDQYEW